MQRWIIGLATSAVALSLSGAGVAAAPLTATYAGYVLDSNNQETDQFTATFKFDTNDLVVDPFENTLFDSQNNDPTATFSAPGTNWTFDSNDYFYTRVSNGVVPIYEFGIKGDFGYLYFKFGGGIEEGEYQLASPGLPFSNLEPTSLLITTGMSVSAVPLPPAALLFGGALVVLGAARFGRTRSRHVALNVCAAVSGPGAA